MDRSDFIRYVIEGLRFARIYAVKARFDEHLVSEIDHLIATVEANMENDEK